jgi:hypothetical protein
LITLGIMFNAISRSEFNEGTAPGVTSVVFGERCRIERSNDCEQKREIDLVQELLVRNRSRNAGPKNRAWSALLVRSGEAIVNKVRIFVRILWLVWMARATAISTSEP